MVRLEENKFLTKDKPIERASLPSRVYIPLSQHVGKICLPEVKVGDYVFLGQCIAKAPAHVYAPIHASVSGKVISIQDWPHPVLGQCQSIVIENDSLDKCQVSSLPCRQAGVKCQEEVERLTPEQIRNIVFESGIIGMGGAGFPTHIKLNPPKPVDTLIVNGAECEPFLTGDYRLMLEKTQEIILGIELVQKCLGAENVYVAIEDNKPVAIKAFEAVCDTCLSLPCRQAGGRQERYAISVLKSIYPQGGEKQLIKNMLGKEVPQGKLPFDIGVVVHNVATIYAIYEAVYMQKPLYERVVTVTGSCLDNPKNLLVRIGTPIKELIDFCGPLKEEPLKIIMGGPMMGIAQFTEEVPVIKSSTAVLLFNKKETEFPDEEFCIRCGACVRDCPAALMPTLINLSCRKGLWSQAKLYGALDCIECGICSFVCPSNIRLVQSIKQAKLELLR